MGGFLRPPQKGSCQDFYDFSTPCHRWDALAAEVGMQREMLRRGAAAAGVPGGGFLRPRAERKLPGFFTLILRCVLGSRTKH